MWQRKDDTKIFFEISARIPCSNIWALKTKSSLINTLHALWLPAFASENAERTPWGERKVFWNGKWCMATWWTPGKGFNAQKH
jgi:hypothetical protein